VRKWMKRTGLVTALLCAMLAVPSLASASTTHNGSFDITAFENQSVDTQQVTTTNHASGCISDFLLTSSEVSFQLIWYNGGRNTVLWGSPDFATGAKHCSPTKTISHPPHDPQIFLIITVHCVSPIDVCQGSGAWQVTTN
jgi:hypothetical protein